MKRAIIAVVVVGAAIFLAGIGYAGYSFYQTTQRAMAEMTSMKNRFPNGGQGSGGTACFPGHSTPGTGTYSNFSRSSHLAGGGTP